MGFVIHWHESAMDLHVLPILIPPPNSLSTRSLWLFPVHQVWALVSCIQPGLVICFTLDNIHSSMLFSWNIPPSPSPSITFKFIGFFLPLNVSVTHAYRALWGFPGGSDGKASACNAGTWVWFLGPAQHVALHHHSLAIWKILAHWVSQIFRTSHKYKKTHSLISPPILENPPLRSCDAHSGW